MTKKATKKQQQEKSNSNVAFGSRLVDCILNFLSSQPEEEFNPATISKRLKIPYNKTTAILSRLHKEGKIWKPHHGYYAIKCTLDKHQIRKKEKKIPLEIHNISMPIPKKLLDVDFKLCKNVMLLSPTVGTKATYKNLLESDEKEQKKTKSNNGEILKISFNISPHQTVTITEYPDTFMFELKADINPLQLSEWFWLKTCLVLLFGDSVFKTEVGKLDFNCDLPFSVSKNQVTVRDIDSTVLSIYGKGGITRAEGRNHQPTANSVNLMMMLMQFANKINRKRKSKANSNTKTTN